MSFTIYLITNKLDGKIYVGQTKQTIRRRWTLHKSKARKDSPLYLHRAIKIHGEDNFQIQPLATCDTQDWADFLEMTWILVKDSFNPKIGYNLTSGGDHPKMSPESVEKQRQKILGAKASEETKRLRSKSLLLAYQEGRHPGNTSAPSEKQLQALEYGRRHHNPNTRHDVLSEELLFLWNNCVQMKDIADRFGISPVTVKKRILSLDLPYRLYKPGGKTKPFDLELLKKFLSQNLSIKEIGRRMGRYPSVISGHILRNNLLDVKA